MNILENYSLKPHLTFGTDTIAQYFVQISSEEELKQLLQTEYAQNPIFFWEEEVIFYSLKILMV